MPIDDSLRPNERARCTPDPLPDAIYVASEKYVITLTTPSESPQFIILTSGAPNTEHIMIR